MNKEDDLTLTFKALPHPIRRRILDLLKSGPRTTTDLNDQFEDVTRYAVMKHLSLLEEANLVLVRREGRMRLNHLNAIALQQIVERWVSTYQSSIASSLLSLKSNLERGTHDMENQQNYKHDSFQIEQELRIQAPISDVFSSLTEGINSWWAYRLCGENSTLSIEPEVGGRFLEKGENNLGALWGTITYINAPYEIRLNGGMTGAVNSAYSYQLREEKGETILSLSHHASGLLDPNWHSAHDEGWKELLGTFLKNYVEKGKTYTEMQK
ncbi:helix-turn-helix domain-containing protein [Pseudalkalibacillus hwajinpoensis]|uniref:helix-turn-helix domain-containing protein n=1 Tax=Guptibacillus hwajinpoensis TaxID=208199 RepID=UPI00325B308A